MIRMGWALFTGTSASLAGDYAIVGAPNAKKAFLFKQASGTWNKIADTSIDGYTNEANFGASGQMTRVAAACMRGLVGCERMVWVRVCDDT